MAREKFGTLTEQMFYILLCLREECCGMDVMARVGELTGGRAARGRGAQCKLEGRRRSYRLTGAGEALLKGEVERLQMQVRDYQTIFEG